MKAFNELNFDSILYPSNILGVETYIRLGFDKDSPVINGYKISKKHKDSNVETIYFLKSEWIEDLPIKIVQTQKVNYKSEVLNVITKRDICRIKPEQKMSWRELIDYTGLPYHSNKLSYTLYKLKCVYARTKKQVYFRAVSDSAFGKTKYLEMLNLLLNKTCIISDATAPKLFFAICWQRMICINELPDVSDKKQYVKFCNQLINIGDKSKSIENPARKTEGTFDVADTSKLSVCFTHNFSKYYEETGLKPFESIFPTNVINRYYYNAYEGISEFHQPFGYNSQQIADKYQEYIKDVIKTFLYFEENIENIENPYPECILDKMLSQIPEPRFREHFIDFSKAVSLYSRDINEYVMLMIEEFKSHMKYRETIKQQNTNNNVVPNNVFSFDEIDLSKKKINI